MVGTFYSSAPGADPYINIGDTVDEETVVCIIEAMKIMNEVKAETEGKIVEVIVENGAAVEFGQPLFRVEASEEGE
jgi:acetyl-CoA carboxylase biotin carboxyl carrier protein